MPLGKIGATSLCHAVVSPRTKRSSASAVQFSGGRII
jgi:hypothetical protein